MTILILCTRLLGVVTLITLVASFFPWHASFDDPHFMHQTVRGGHTDHTGSIVSLMACIFDLKKKFLCNWTLIKIVLNRRAIALVWKRLTILILCIRLLGVVILITLVASFLSWHASLILKRNFYVTGHSYCYSLGMVKMEAYDDSHFMHQAVRGGHTDHTGSIVSLMAFIFDLKKNFLCNWTLIKIVLYLVW